MGYRMKRAVDGCSIGSVTDSEAMGASACVSITREVRRLVCTFERVR